ncbi:MAG TPA: hypothetical protein VHN78_03810, partial [Chloroflexota bacterium]|nr:hypothetical protein [Chloroflexota bacterium]
MSDGWPWLALGLLGAYHGLNPGMGWLFAVALGLQERSRKAVLLALPPIALGHEVSVALVALLVSGVGLVAAPESLRPVGAAALVLFGLYRFLGPRAHPRWVGMRVSARELVLWSFLVSSAHGAGLMLFPVLLDLPAVSPAHESPEIALGATAAVRGAAAATVHALAMLLTMGAVAVLVYEKLGVAVLRRAWVNMDALWAAALVAAGIVTLLT